MPVVHRRKKLWIYFGDKTVSKATYLKEINIPFTGYSINQHDTVEYWLPTWLYIKWRSNDIKSPEENNC